MSQFIIEGDKELRGEIKVSGAKNSALKLLAASVMAEGVCIIHNVPNIIDIAKMEDIMSALGAKIRVADSTVSVDAQHIQTTVLEPHLTKKIRGSIVLVGPMLSRFNQVTITEPGGCLIGTRSIDDHIELFKQFGVDVLAEGDNYIFKGKPQSGEIILNKLSVTATENAIMAAVLSPGKTTIRVAAAEPEIKDLADYLNKMGAKISGAGTHDIEIHGVEKLIACTHEVIPDRIEAATYIMAAVITNSELTIGPLNPNHLSLVFSKIKKAGVRLEVFERDSKTFVKVLKHNGITSQNIDTRTYPGFPTDLQSVYAVLMTQASGCCRIFETLFESRFGYTEELKRMNAHIEVVSPHIIEIHGPRQLKGQEIDAFDIRGGSALVLAGLAAKGKTIIRHAEMIERGYENMNQKLAAVGANITKTE